jgi:hypothetical protein
MADQHNPNIPALTNQIAADIPDIKENLEFHKDVFEAIGNSWSDTDATAYANNRFKRTAYSASATLSAGCFWCDVDSSTAHVGLAIASAALFGDKTVLIVKNNGNNGCTLDPDDGATIDGASTYGLSENDEVVALGTDGINWHVLWKHLPESNLPNNYLSGFKLSVDATDVHDLVIGTGQCKDSSNTYNLTLASALVKQVDNIWAAGTNVGGLADSEGGTLSTGALSAGTWLHVFVIKNTSTGSVDAGFDTALNASNLLNTSEVLSVFTGTIAYRRVGSIKCDDGGVTGSIELFLQYGDEFAWKDPPSASTLLSTAASVLPVVVPPDISFDVELNTYIDNGEYYISNPDIDDEAPSTTDAPLLTGKLAADFDLGNTVFRVRTNTSQQIRGRVSGVGTSSWLFRWATLRWFDRRGKDG